MSYCQPVGDETRRVDLPAASVSEAFAVDGTYTFFEGRAFPVGARGEGVTFDRTVSLNWTWITRPAAEAALALLRAVAQEADARLDVHIDAAVGGTAVDFVGEAHEVPADIDAVTTTAEIVFRQVDTS